MARTSSARPSASAGRLGPSDSGAGRPAGARAWRRCRSNARIPAASIGNGPMTAAGCRRAWPPRWGGLTSAWGCMHNSGGRSWPLRTWWTGSLIGFHTKRLIIFASLIRIRWLCRHSALDHEPDSPLREPRLTQRHVWARELLHDGSRGPFRNLSPIPVGGRQTCCHSRYGARGPLGDAHPLRANFP